MAVTYQPLFDRMLVRVLAAGDRTKGGLFIPSVALDGTPWMRAEVVAQGHGRLMGDGTVVPMTTKVGDVVVFFRTQSSGEQLVVPVEDEELLCIRESNVLAIVHGLDRDTGILTPEGGRFTMDTSA